ncbi:hypothetical protein BGZ94_000215 [Podila epigama]|nr:hypothetical protein BGZ94_000215 [Podila epigama]
MSARHHNNLSIDTANANAAARRTLPSPMSSTGSLHPCPPEEMISTATLSHPPTLSIPSVPYPPNSHYAQQQQLQRMQQQQQQQQNRPSQQQQQQGNAPQPQQRQRYRSLSGGNGGGPIHSWTGNENSHANHQQGPYGPEGPSAMPGMNRRPSVPVNHYYLQQQQQQQQNYRNPHQSSYAQHREHNQQQQQQQQHPSQPQQPLTPSTPSSNPTPVVRHPLWRLECSSCKTVLCEQAMQGHLVGDPSKKLFSTNQAIG